jgi:hypothetical protein
MRVTRYGARLSVAPSRKGQRQYEAFYSGTSQTLLACQQHLVIEASGNGNGIVYPISQKSSSMRD